MKYSVSDAAKIVGTTRQTIYRHISSKPISVEKDEQGNQYIEASELLRIYGNKINFDAVNSPNEKRGKLLQDVTDVDTTIPFEIAQEKIKSANTQIEMLQEQLQRERSVMEEQVQTLKTALEKSQESNNRTVALLEDKTSKVDEVNEHNKRFEALEKANEELRKQNRRVLYELKSQASLTLWERIFGIKEKTSSHKEKRQKSS